MRLNLGIRRRLAPLLANDRARIELANSLLFSLPGSPVIYYGDEIGMGDNIWLDDRDGVRTPMQWSAAPNAGFSTASPSALYSPVIDDEVYGYRVINVEAQRADPGSLLNRLRQMIRVRKAQPALSRGDVRFLDVDPPGVLAFLRTHGDTPILSLNNLSSEPHTVDLDLSGWRGIRPADLFTGESLAPIGAAAYRLDLDRYHYRWLAI
jgi:maltose alpha-D-glucosyltransferase/alpha-amylase